MQQAHLNANLHGTHYACQYYACKSKYSSIFMLKHCHDYVADIVMILTLTLYDYVADIV